METTHEIKSWLRGNWGKEHGHQQTIGWMRSGSRFLKDLAIMPSHRGFKETALRSSSSNSCGKGHEDSESSCTWELFCECPLGVGTSGDLNTQLKTREIKVQQLVNFIARVSMVASISHPGNLMGGRNCFLDRCSQSHGWNALNHDPQGTGVSVRPEVHHSGSASLWLTQS